jgi:hypothetical protein
MPVGIIKNDTNFKDLTVIVMTFPFHYPNWPEQRRWVLDNEDYGKSHLVVHEL